MGRDAGLRRDPAVRRLCARCSRAGSAARTGIANSLVQTAPLLLTGLAVGVCFKAGLFNIGAQGQFLFGALGAAAVGAALADSNAALAIPLALIAGVVLGAGWGFIPGFLKAVTGAHEVVTTIMLNFIAATIIGALVVGPLLGPGVASETAEVRNAALPVDLRAQPAPRGAHRLRLRAHRLLAALEDDHRLRGQDGRCQPDRRALRRHAAGAA